MEWTAPSLRMLSSVAGWEKKERNSYVCIQQRQKIGGKHVPAPFTDRADDVRRGYGQNPELNAPGDRLIAENLIQHGRVGITTVIHRIAIGLLRLSVRRSEGFDGFGSAHGGLLSDSFCCRIVARRRRKVKNAASGIYFRKTEDSACNFRSDRV